MVVMSSLAIIALHDGISIVLTRRSPLRLSEDSATSRIILGDVHYTQNTTSQMLDKQAQHRVIWDESLDSGNQKVQSLTMLT